MIKSLITAGRFVARYVHENSHGFGFEVCRVEGSSHSRVGIVTVVIDDDGRCSGVFHPNDGGTNLSILDLVELSILVSRCRDNCYNNVPSPPPSRCGIDDLMDAILRRTPFSRS